jgi:multiple sugar transport system permease protein
MVTTVLAAFAFARLNFKGKEVLFSILLATMMIPGEIFVITNYATVSSLGWKNTYTALVLPFMVSVFYIFFLRQTFRQIPNELYLAAKVDGTGDFKYLWKVMIPMAKSTITSILILSMMGTWNAYVWPNLVAGDDNMLLVSNGLMKIFAATDETKPMVAYQMAAAVLVTLPLLVVFLLLRKQIMNGVSRSGIKG